MLLRLTKLIKGWPVLLLLAVEVLLFLTNFTPGTYLMGWDNIMPEFNVKANVMRSLVGVWQEYRGLGLYDGMSHIAALWHTLAIALVSFAVPQNMVRYFTTFSLHFLGGFGMYLLLKHLFGKINFKLNHILADLLALSGSLFYLLNPATIQMFYTPLEAFNVHFGALPWLALTLLNFLDRGTKKSLFYFLLVTLATSAQFFVPTMLIPVTILLIILCVSFKTFNSLHLKRIAIAALGFLVVNTFWLLPYLYGVPNHATQVGAAKINQMSSEEDFLRNQAFGDLQNVLTLKGFSLNFEDYAPNGQTIYLMETWRNFWATPWAITISYALAGLMLLGVISTLVKRDRKILPFVLTLGLSFLILGNNLPLIRDATGFFRDHLPLLAEALRFPFTKFSLIYALGYSVLITYGLYLIIEFVEKYHRRLPQLAVLTTILLILIYTAPSFEGYFISPYLRVKLPDEYNELFQFMNTQNPNARVAYLPQPSYWSWKFYRWGYRGSGFVWFGLPQSLLDRAFDPWNGQNENYYWESSQALYSKNAKAFAAVLSKYAVRYLLLDENLVTSGNDRALYTDEIKDLLSQNPDIKLVAKFGRLSLYELTALIENNFVSLKTNLPAVNQKYNWTDNDVAYQQLGDYITQPTTYNSQLTTIYPFRSLFTKRAVTEREFNVVDNGLNLTISSPTEATSATISKKDLVYDSDKTQSLIASAVSQCGVLREGKTSVTNEGDVSSNWLRLTSVNQTNCLSSNTSQVWQRFGYLVEVVSRHVTGRPALFALINNSAKHTEIETYLPTSTNWQTSYFILPPLAHDGLDYNVYISNDSIGDKETVNDIKSVRFYTLPYEEMVNLRNPNNTPLASNSGALYDFTVSHPNPAYYKINLQPTTYNLQPATLILNQAYDAGWVAIRIKPFSVLQPTTYNLQLLSDHVLVNNWANGWTIKSCELYVLGCRLGSKNANSQLTTNNLQPTTIIIFFWPQLLEWLGFLILPIPLIFALYKKSASKGDPSIISG